MLTTTDVGNVTQGHGVLDHQSISGAQHVQVQCAVGVSRASAVLEGGGLSNQGPAVGARQCVAVSIRRTDTLQRGLVGLRQRAAVALLVDLRLHK